MMLPFILKKPHAQLQSQPLTADRLHYTAQHLKVRMTGSWLTKYFVLMNP